MSRAASSDEADLDGLTGVCSGQRPFCPEHRSSAERLERVIQAMDRISGALVRTTQGPGTLVRSVVRATAEHISADWVIFAIADGALPDASPRHLVLGPHGQEVASVDALPDGVRQHLNLIRVGAQHSHQQAEFAPARHTHAPVTLDGQVIGAFVVWAGSARDIDGTDESVLRILAGQTAAALQNSALHQRTEQLLARTGQLYAQATRHAEDLAARNDELQRAQAQLAAAQQRELLDAERHRIARELHDSVSQYALSAGMQIEIARAEVSDPGLAGTLESAKELARSAVDQLRSAIYALNHTESADHASLPVMLEQLATVHLPDELHVEVRVRGTPRLLSGAAEQSLLRVVGEALFNTAVHGRARRAVVGLSYRDGGLTLSVDDDGHGDPAAVRRSLRVAAAGDLAGRHCGLANMQARARELDGSLSVRRARMGGLRIQVTVPLTATPEVTDD